MLRNNTELEITQNACLLRECRKTGVVKGQNLELQKTAMIVHILKRRDFILYLGSVLCRVLSIAVIVFGLVRSNLPLSRYMATLIRIVQWLHVYTSYISIMQPSFVLTCLIE